MLKTPTLVATAALALAMSSAHGDEPKPPDGNKADGIKAEVTGTLRFVSGHGYYISVSPAAKPKESMRVWLYISENKVLVRKLQRLTGKTVMAKGNLAQIPEGHQTSIPPLGMYMGSFKIEDVGTPWSAAVEGLQCRLLADKVVWKASEVPAFQLEVRDQGKRDLDIHVSQAACKLEFDGVWYEWNGPVSIPAGTWPAGRQYDDFEVRCDTGSPVGWCQQTNCSEAGQTQGPRRLCHSRPEASRPRREQCGRNPNQDPADQVRIRSHADWRSTMPSPAFSLT